MENTELTTEVKSKATSQEKVRTYEDEYGNSFKYKVMPNKPSSWVQKLERNYASEK